MTPSSQVGCSTCLFAVRHLSAIGSTILVVIVTITTETINKRGLTFWSEDWGGLGYKDEVKNASIVILAFSTSVPSSRLEKAKN